MTRLFVALLNAVDTMLDWLGSWMDHVDPPAGSHAAIPQDAASPPPGAATPPRPGSDGPGRHRRTLTAPNDTACDVALLRPYVRVGSAQEWIWLRRLEAGR